MEIGGMEFIYKETNRLVKFFKITIIFVCHYFFTKEFP